jgi:hypothetical protein
MHMNHSINVNVVDTQGVKQFFKNHGKTALRAYNESVRGTENASTAQDNWPR